MPPTKWAQVDSEGDAKYWQWPTGEMPIVGLSMANQNEKWMMMLTLIKMVVITRPTTLDHVVDTIYTSEPSAHADDRPLG